MKSGDIITLSAVALSIFAISATPQQKYLGFPAAYVDKLTVNLKNEYKNIVNKNEEEGVKDIRHLVKTSQYEEAWAYLPDKEQWVEIGVNEYVKRNIDYFLGTHKELTFYFMRPNIADDNGGTLTGHSLDAKILKELMKKNKNLIIDHFHPEDSIGNMLPASVTSPSPPDLYTIAKQTINHGKYQPKGSIRFKVCSQYGVVEYRITEEGKMNLENRTKKHLEEWSNSSFEDIVEQLRPALLSGIKTCAFDKKDIDSEFLIVRFKPYGIK